MPLRGVEDLLQLWQVGEDRVAAAPPPVVVKRLEEFLRVSS